MFWWFDAGATPDLIPNSEVKPCSSDDTLLEGKVASRQNTVLKPKKILTLPARAVWVFFLVSFPLCPGGIATFP